MTCDDDSPGGTDKPPHHMSDKRGPHLVRGPERNGNPGKRVPVPVAGPRGEDVAHKLSMGTGIKRDVEKPRSSDLNASDPGRTNQPPPQNLSDDERVPLTPLTPGQQQGDIGGVIPTPGPRRRPHLHPLRHGNAQLVVLNGTTHGVQHSAGELGGSHGTSVWEEGGTKANRFRPSDEHTTGEPRPGPKGSPGPRTPQRSQAPATTEARPPDTTEAQAPDTAEAQSPRAEPEGRDPGLGPTTTRWAPQPTRHHQARPHRPPPAASAAARARQDRRARRVSRGRHRRPAPSRCPSRTAYTH